MAISAISGWEISIKRAAGKLDAPEDLEEQVIENSFEVLPITLLDGLSAGMVPPVHQDPFDHMLVAQAKARGLVLATRDARLEPYGVDVLRA